MVDRAGLVALLQPFTPSEREALVNHLRALVEMTPAKRATVLMLTGGG